MSLTSQLESILFVASKPLAAKKIAKVLNINDGEISAALNELAQKYNQPESGLRLLNNNGEWQLVSSPDNSAATENFIKSEVSGELTRPQLEALTVVAYCGPITKPELEQIRGVNCSLILRNLMLRGLVKESDDVTALLPTFEVTMDYLRQVGLNSVSELPDYAELHQHQFITQALETNANS